MNTMRYALPAAALLLTACVSNSSMLTPKNVVQAELDTVQIQSHYEYQSHCGKPCQPVTVRWQRDGSYTVQHGYDAPVSGRMDSARVTALAKLYSELRQLTVDMPSDLTRASFCERFATDHAVKTFSNPEHADGWRFKDNHGCMGFANADRLRQLEAKIDAMLPVPNAQ
jgi:hypothetical protein